VPPAGVGMVRRKWPMPGWALAAVVGLFMVAASVGTGFGVDVAPQVKARFNSLQHNQTYVLKESVSRVQLQGTNAAYRLVQDQQSSQNSVEIQSYGVADPKQISVTLRDGLLTVDTRRISKPGCTPVCPYEDGNITEVIIHAPHADTLKVDAPKDAALIRRDETVYKTIYRDGGIQYLAPAPPRPSIDN